ncbi:DNA-processing protein DprA [Arthrobacter sp. TMS2-4]
MVEASASASALDAELSTAALRIQRWESDGTRFLTYLDPEYPRQLREVHDLPPFVFARGTLNMMAEAERGVSIVGSRDASSPALRDAARLAKALVERGISVVSGLAAGIDSAAHAAALETHGRTVAVIGTGIDRYYPKSSESLQRRMESGEGLVLSQFWPGSSATKFSFPMRNVVMSAFSRATVIVEAAEKSGTRHQAFRAIAHGRPLILSRKVASQTTWGQKLSSDPKRLDVTVVDSLEEAIRAAAAKAQPIHVAKPSQELVDAEW